MHTGPVSPQPAGGLSCSSQLPLSLPQYIHFILSFSVGLSSHNTRLFEILFALSCLCLSHSLSPAAQGQMQGNGAPGGCQRESYSWKALSHPCSCSHDLRRRGRRGREGERARERLRIFLCRKGLLFKSAFKSS